LEEVAGTTPQLVIYLTALCFWGGLVLLAVYLYIRARRAWVDAHVPEPESSEDILGKGEARRLARQALQDAWENFLGRLRPAQRYLAAARIRRIYQELLDLFAERTCLATGSYPIGIFARYGGDFARRWRGPGDDHPGLYPCTLW